MNEKPRDKEKKQELLARNPLVQIDQVLTRELDLSRSSYDPTPDWLVKYAGSLIEARKSLRITQRVIKSLISVYLNGKTEEDYKRAVRNACIKHGGDQEHSGNYFYTELFADDKEGIERSINVFGLRDEIENKRYPESRDGTKIIRYVASTIPDVYLKVCFNNFHGKNEVIKIGLDLDTNMVAKIAKSPSLPPFK